MQIFKKRKEIVPFIAIVITLSIAAYDLFSEQQSHSQLLNSGKRIDPISINGRAACEIPIPDISKRETEAKFTNETKELTD